MLFYELNPEEQELENSLEQGEWVSVENVEELKQEIVAAARLTGAKTRTINIRLPERDLHRLKAKAAQEACPIRR